MNFPAPKLIQHVIAIGEFSSSQIDATSNSYSIGSIKNLGTGSYFAIFLVNFPAPKLIQHVIAIGPVKNLNTYSYFAHFWQIFYLPN